MNGYPPSLNQNEMIFNSSSKFAQLIFRMLNLLLFVLMLLLSFLYRRICPIFQISNVTGDNIDLLKMFLNLLSARSSFVTNQPAIFQIDDTYSVPVSTLTSFTLFSRFIYAMEEVVGDSHSDAIIGSGAMV